MNVEHGPFYILRNPIPCLIIALIVAGVAVAFMSYSNKARMTVTGNTYMDKMNLECTYAATDISILLLRRREYLRKAVVGVVDRMEVHIAAEVVDTASVEAEEACKISLSAL